MLKIKVCGMKDPANASRISGLPVDYVGFVFFRGSRRYAGDNPPAELFDSIRPGVRKTGVFVDSTVKEVSTACHRAGIDVVQLHGAEDPDYCKELKDCGFTVIKAFNPTDAGSILLYSEVCDFFLFDSRTGSNAGSGIRFDWSVLNELDTGKPFFLSGGIGPGDVPAIMQIRNRNLYGVDINSRFETTSGIKSEELTANFIQQLKSGYYELSCK